MYQRLFLFISEYHAHDLHTEKNVCMGLHRGMAIYTDMMGFVPIFLCANYRFNLMVCRIFKKAYLPDNFKAAFAMMTMDGEYIIYWQFEFPAT